MIENYKKQKWKEYYNSPLYSCYIFNDIIFLDNVWYDKQYIIKYDKKIYEKIKKLGLIPAYNRKPNEEDLETLMNVFYNVDKSKIYTLNEIL